MLESLYDDCTTNVLFRSKTYQLSAKQKMEFKIHFSCFGQYDPSLVEIGIFQIQKKGLTVAND